jgi:Grx4 family monothiol glutaredoxin
MKDLTDEAEFRTIKQSSPFPRGLVVHWGAAWCAPCADLTAYLTDVAKAGFSTTRDVGFLYVDVEKFPEVTEMEGVDSVPHVGFYRTDAVSKALSLVAEVSGAKIPAIQLNLRSLFGHDSRAMHADLDSYLKHLINRDNVVAFITGTPSRPMCGFTGRLMQLFDELAVPFTFVDIMESAEVCEGLKAFSSWPTYPQVYVEGELVGGLDICAELHKNNQLKSTLKL